VAEGKEEEKITRGNYSNWILGEATKPQQYAQGNQEKARLGEQYTAQQSTLAASPNGCIHAG
jgi:hypothetical protein